MDKGCIICGLIGRVKTQKTTGENKIKKEKKREEVRRTNCKRYLRSVLSHVCDYVCSQTTIRSPSPSFFFSFLFFWGGEKNDLQIEKIERQEREKE